jgi:hypothetical protein
MDAKALDLALLAALSVLCAMFAWAGDGHRTPHLDRPGFSAPAASSISILWAKCVRVFIAATEAA